MQNECTMRLSDDEHDRLERRLKNKDDAVVAANVIETLVGYMRSQSSSQVKSLLYNVHDTTSDADTFVLRFTKGVDVFTHEYMRVILNVSWRVLDVRLDFAERCVDVEIKRTRKNDEREPFLAPTYRRPRSKKRRLSTDFTGSAVHDRADQSMIDTLVDEVYTSVPRIPAAMVSWFETINDGAAGDESESLAQASSKDGTSLLGYSVCFTHMPAISVHFLEYLMGKHAAHIASAYAWFSPKRIDSPVFVINCHADATRAEETKVTVRSHLPRGVDASTAPSSKKK